ncbi:MAG: type II toxin-antitoxin system VapC family toxin [Rhizonema sp. NSF051]|nr:type II toxin-antitoxin system VapC family toxin [Rhizonema sp. NSF051]
MILCDTNIVIEFYKNNTAIIQELRLISIHQLAISVITRAELYYGAINKNELNRILQHLDLLQNIPIDQPISEKFIQLMAQYSLSHKLTIPDALIAATALIHNISLYTLNLKDFRFIQGLNIYNPTHSL